MIDNFSLGLTHLLLMVAAWRLLFRADLDRDPPAAPRPARNSAEQPAGFRRPPPRA